MKNYIKIAQQTMRPYEEGEDMRNISVSPEDVIEIGGMIAINPHNPKDRWYIGKLFFEQNYEEASKSTDTMTFGNAIDHLKSGHKVARKGWNGKGMWLILQNTTKQVNLHSGSLYEKALNHSGPIQIDAHIDMYTAGKTMQPGWLASQADMLSDDWEIVK